MAKAAISFHAPALYSLAVIQFNGSGGSKNDKDLRAGVALCARAAFLGHIDALRELGHCLQDGYGIRQNITEGRRFLVQANARELASVFSSFSYTLKGFESSNRLLSMASSRILCVWPMGFSSIVSPSTLRQIVFTMLISTGTYSALFHLCDLHLLY